MGAGCQLGEGDARDRNVGKRAEGAGNLRVVGVDHDGRVQEGPGHLQTLVDGAVHVGTEGGSVNVGPAREGFDPLRSRDVLAAGSRDRA